MKNLYISAAVAAMIALPGMASAAVVLDDFSVVQRAGDEPAGEFFPLSSTISDAGFLADTRTLSADNGGTDGLVDTSLVSNQQLKFSNQDNVNGTASASYTFDGIDLTGFASFSVDVTFFDQDNASTMLSLMIDDETVDTSISKANVGSTITFAGFSAANLASVSSVSLMFGPSTSASVDASIDNFVGNVSEVPLPAGAVLLLTGLAGLGFARRKA